MIAAASPVRTGSCLSGCGRCCQFLEIETNPAYLGVPDVLNWLTLHGLALSMKDGRCIARLPIPCQELKADKSCRLMGSPRRPKLCGEWPNHPDHIAEIPECGFQFVNEEDLAVAG